MLNDLVSGLVMSAVTIPGALANGLLAGVNPVFGVYSVIAGTSVAAIFTSSVIMNVDSTSATSIATGDFLGMYASDEQLGYLVVLGILVGLFMLLFGVLKLGFLVRFISNAVMTGFLSGLGVLTILGQVGDITGYHSDAPNKVFQSIDTLLNWQKIDPATLLLGLITIFAVILISRTQYDRYGFAIGIVLATILALLPIFGSALVVGDVTEIPRGLPRPNMPDLFLMPSLILPALIIAIIALVQAAGVSQSAPNPDGEYPEPSGDFKGQGAANVAVGIFGGIPVGGSLSGTALIQSIGGLSRWANLFTAIFSAVILALFAPMIEFIPLTGLAGLLIVVGFSMIKVGRIETVWNTGATSSLVMVITFVVTLFLDLQVAVVVGVVLTFLIYIYQSAESVRLERVIRSEDGFFEETDLPTQLSSSQVMAIQPVGSLFFAGTAEFENRLPDTGDAHRSVVIIRLRDRDEVGSTFIRAIKRYTIELQSNNNKLMLVGLNQYVVDQLEKTDLLALIGEENIFPAQRKYGAALIKAWAEAEEWIASQTL